MFDAFLHARTAAVAPKEFDAERLLDNGYVLATVHRQENTNDPVRLRSIFRGLARSMRPVVLPLHPRTRAALNAFGIDATPNVHIVDPVGYYEMVWLTENAQLIATDSGGLQKEAYFASKPCVTLRDETEWTELVEGGFNRLVGASEEAIARAINDDAPRFQPMNLYGDGKASEAILRVLLSVAGSSK
jgi:UDP-GlcNAc3NAcA epimerase